MFNYIFIISISLKAILVSLTLSLIYLIIKFFRNASLTAYLEKDEIDSLYNREWEQENVLLLDEILISRKKILKIIPNILYSIFMCVALLVLINSSYLNNKVSNYSNIITDMYCTSIEEIPTRISRYKNVFSEESYRMIDPLNIDNFENRYEYISSPNNRINIVSEEVRYNNIDIEFEIIRDNVLLSRRKVFITLENGVINTYNEYVFTPLESTNEFLKETLK